MPAIKDIAGQRFGRLTAIAAVEKRHHRWYWRCQCDCGQETVVCGNDLRNGKTKSCGCLMRESRFTHGASRTGEYNSWVNMMQRCYNPDNKDFKNYGGCGIKVCKRWHDFRNLLADMGLRPLGKYSIERLDVYGDYEPSNCIWLPMSEQSKNRRKREPWKQEGISRTTWYRRHGTVSVTK